MKLSGKKVIVTGGAGFIGAHLVDALVSEGFKVHVIDNLSGGKREQVNKKAHLHTLDITNLDLIRPVFKDAAYVFHLAALPRVPYSIKHPIETNRVNVEGTLNVLVASHNAGVKRVIYAASSSAYGDNLELPLKETLPPMPKSPYGLQKYIGELYCRVWHQIYGLETVSLRYFNVYGPRSSHEGAYALVIAKFLRQRTMGEPMTVTGDGEQTRDFTYVRDVVRATILAMKSSQVGKGEVINIGAGQNQSVNRVAQLIGGPVVHIEPRLEPRHTLADNSLAKELLGWEPTISLEEGIEELKSLYLA